jgi:hypothetical protein
MRQIEVINLETIIDVTAETSNVEILVKDYDSELVERFALEAQEAAIDAEESADIATAQASIATAQAGIATTQAGIATTQAGNALTSANNAAASAQEAQDIVDSIITADLTEATSSVLTITGGTDAVLGTGTTIQVKQAGSSQSGFLSSTDWTTFNSKQNTITNPITGTIATGQVAFGTAANTVGGDSGLVWNNTVKRLELLGTDSSTIRLRGNTNGAGYFVTQINSNSTAIALGNAGVITGTGTSNILWSNTDLDIFISNTQRARFFSANGNLILQNGGTFTDAGFRLDVNGTARVQGALNVNLGVGSITNTISVRNTSATAYSSVTLFDNRNNNSFVGQWGLYGSSVVGNASNMFFYNTAGGGIGFYAGTGASPTNDIRLLLTASGNTLIGTTTDAGFRLDVNGTARVQGVLTATADAVVNGVSVGRGGGNSSTSTVLGNSALSVNTSGIDNTAIGSLSLTNITSGNNNVALGRSSGRFISDSTTFNTISNNSIFLGWRTKPLADNQTNQIVIGYDSTGLGSNTTVLGNSSTTFGRWFGNLLVGTSTNAGFALDVVGTARVTGAITGTSTLTLGQTGTAGEVILNRSSNGAVVGGIRADGNGAEIGGSGYSSKILCSNGGTRIQFFTTTERMRLEGGNLLIGTTTDVASSKLTIESTTQGVLFPRMTTTQKNAIASPATGLVVYDTTLNKLSVRGALTWETVTSL